MRRPEKNMSRYEMLLYYRDILKEYKFKLLGIGFLEMLAACYYLVNPVFLEIFTDQVIIGRKNEMLKFVCIGTIGLYLLYCTVEYFSKWLRITTVNEIILRIKKKCMLVLLYGERSSFEEYGKGDIEHIFSEDFLMLDKFFNSHVVDYIVCVVFACITSVGMLLVNWKLLLISGIIIPIPYLALKLIGQINYVRVKKRRDIYGEYEGFLFNSLRLWSSVKLQNLKKRELKKFLEYRHKIAKYDIQSGYFEYIGNMVEFISEILATRIIIYLAGGFMVINKSISIGNLLVFISYFEYFYKQIKQINQWQYELSNDMPSLNKIKELMSIKREYEVDKQRLSLEGNILFDNVTFSYKNGNKVLDKFSLKVNAGEKIAIVGENGCGKSTIIKLLLGICQADSGNIFIDGHKIRELTNQNIADNVGTVLQNFKLFDMSISDNLKLFAIDATMEDIEAACIKVGLSGYIESLPKRYDTYAGENGSNLSGGQRQRLALARLFMKERSIIVLDEVSSAIDMEAERELFAEVFNHFKKNTILFISHRKKPLLLADRIIVLEQGAIVGMGTHKELIESNCYYQKLFL